MFGIASLFSHRTFIGLIGLAFLFSACSEKSKSKGEECFYETIETHAEIKELKPDPAVKGKILVILDFKASILALEDQELGALKGFEIDHDFLVRNGIELGNQYEVAVSELVKGECDTKLTVAFNHNFE